MHLFQRPRSYGRGWQYWTGVAAIVLISLLSLPRLAMLVRLATALGIVDAPAAPALFLHQPTRLMSWSQWWVPGRWGWLQQQPALLRTTNGVDCVIVLVAIIGVLVWWKRRPSRPSIAFGSARDPSFRELLPLWDPPPLPHPTRCVLAVIALCAPGRWRGIRRRRPLWAARLERGMRRAKARLRLGGIPLGYFKGLRLRLPLAWLYEGVLLIGVTGTGKTLRFIMRAVVACRGRMPLILSDPKGELKDALASLLRRIMPVWIVDPRDPTAQHFNPLQQVETLEDSYRLASILVELGPDQKPGSHRSSNQETWDGYAVETLVMLIQHLRATEPQAPFRRLLDLGGLLTFSQMKSIIARSPDAEVQALGKQWLETLGASAEAVGATLGTLSKALKPYRTSLVTVWTATDDLNFHKLAHQPIALFLTIADYDMQALRPITAFLYDRLFRVVMQEALASPGKHLKLGCLCFLDEFGNVGRIPEFERFLTLARARRIALVLAVQNLAQLTTTYGHEIDETIAINCRTKILLKGAGEQERRMFNQLLGKRTVLTTSVTESSRGRSRHRREVARDRVTEEELLNMDEDQAVIVTGHVRGFIARVPKITEDPRYRRMVQLPPPAP